MFFIYFLYIFSELYANRYVINGMVDYKKVVIKSNNTFTVKLSYDHVPIETNSFIIDSTDIKEKLKEFNNIKYTFYQEKGHVICFKFKQGKLKIINAYTIENILFLKNIIESWDIYILVYVKEYKRMLIPKDD
ncbi:hypothetical protein EHP00_1832 [Ecytonucleospora hepatopenaei]|uniref:Uncharacterized protein n=1 Tax=Ecytonucleospora hepatopenaei TaxID=646526 RepID=A0A1W0E2V5_9MICR|nr:hypothetical protein EHP00_1832 [Ecytonucleospora hepatopenaei]